MVTYHWNHLYKTHDIDFFDDIFSYLFKKIIFGAFKECFFFFLKKKLKVKTSKSQIKFKFEKYKQNSSNFEHKNNEAIEY